MGIEIECDVLIQQPLAFVAEYSSDFVKLPNWSKTILSVQWHTPKPLKVGSQFKIVEKIRGNDVTYTGEVTEWEPHEYIVLRTQDAPMPREIVYTWTAMGTKATRMVLRSTAEPKGPFKFLASMNKAALEKAEREDLDKLKEILESKHYDH